MGVHDRAMIGEESRDMTKEWQTGDTFMIGREAMPALFSALATQGYDLVGPTVRDGVVVYDRLASVTDLPIGWADEQDRGGYRLKRRADEALFGFNVGPDSWKKYLYPPREPLWTARRDGDGFVLDDTEALVPRYAFIGVRACEMHAIQVQDKVFLDGPYVDPRYRARREAAFILAVNCGQAGGNSFCASMGTGPRHEDGYDLLLTELMAPAHRFVGEVGSERGAAALTDVPAMVPTEADLAQAEAVSAATEGSMGRELVTEGLKALLQRQIDHPRWSAVAERCLSCTSCTMVCPTCFCHTVEDSVSLIGDIAERTRVWDSCFRVNFSYMHGGSIRQSPKSRYRQWMTHKLANWVDQFGQFGCVGCGRCITWCPVGIDITEEAAAIRASESS
jgi:Fe-S-cluster-containing hydrogenase component 2